LTKLTLQNTERLLTFYAEKVAEFMGGNSPFTFVEVSLTLVKIFKIHLT